MEQTKLDEIRHKLHELSYRVKALNGHMMSIVVDIEDIDELLDELDADEQNKGGF